MSDPHPLLEVGRIDRAHGIRGEVVVTLLTERTDRLAPGAVLVADGAGELTVARAQPHGQRWIVAFDGVDGRVAAESLAATTLLAEPVEDPDALWAHELIGARVRTPVGADHGTVAAIVANPVEDLLELDDGTLVPAGFVTDPSGLPEVVVVDPPAGLLGDG